MVIKSFRVWYSKKCDACKTLGADEPKYIVHGGDIMLKFNALQSAKVLESIAAKNQNVTKEKESKEYSAYYWIFEFSPRNRMSLWRGDWLALGKYRFQE